MFAIEMIVIVCTQIKKWNIIFEHMVNRNKHRMGNRNGCSVFSSPCSDALILC